MFYLTSNFVDFIWTIEITVASPSRRYAIILGAGEFWRTTGDRFAIFLVAAVSTVVVAVAHPRSLDTSLVCARKLVRSTSVVWRKRVLCTRKKWNKQINKVKTIYDKGDTTNLFSANHSYFNTDTKFNATIYERNVFNVILRHIYRYL